MSRTINIAVARAVLAEIKGQFLTVSAIKKDKTPTKINGQLVASPASHKDFKNLVTIKRGNNRGYRTFNITQITQINYGGQCIKIRA